MYMVPATVIASLVRVIMMFVSMLHNIGFMLSKRLCWFTYKCAFASKFVIVVG